jgi:hypothetical protein
MSVLAAPFWIGIALARQPRPQRAFKKVTRWYVIFCGIYVFAVLYVIPRLGG